MTAFVIPALIPVDRAVFPRYLDPHNSLCGPACKGDITCARLVITSLPVTSGKPFIHPSSDRIRPAVRLFGRSFPPKLGASRSPCRRPTPLLVAAQAGQKPEFESDGSKPSPCNYLKLVVIEVRPFVWRATKFHSQPSCINVGKPIRTGNIIHSQCLSFPAAPL